jgi:hypothetical protein
LKIVESRLIRRHQRPDLTAEVRCTTARRKVGRAVRAGGGEAGRAGASRRPTLPTACSRQPGPGPWGAEPPGRGDPETRIDRDDDNAATQYTAADAEAPELLGTVTAEALVGLERAQLLAITLASRELAYLLNNDLGFVALALDLIQQEPSLPDKLQEPLTEAVDNLGLAARRISELQRLTRFETKETAIGPALDLEPSVQRRGDTN